MKSKDTGKQLFKYLFLGSFVMFLCILFPISLFSHKNLMFLVIILGFLIFFALIFKDFNKKNKKTIDLFNQNYESKARFASKVDYEEEELYCLNGNFPKNYSKLKKL